MINSSDTTRGQPYYLRFLCLAVLAYSSATMTQTSLPETLSEPDTQTLRLSNQEILQAFADVRDDAEVQDTAGSRAVNHWYANGHFISRWSDGVKSGEVTGTWRVENDQRCITITAGLPKRIGQESCSAVFRRGSQYLSSNPDGSIHGIHSLSPLPQTTE